MQTEDAQPLTVVARRVVKSGCEAAFESAMREFIARSLEFPGSSDFHVVRPSDAASREYTVVHRFTSEAARRAFVDSPLYGEWMMQLRSLSEEEPRIQEFGGIAGWFTLPGRPMRTPPPRFMMAVVTFIGVYPMTSLLPRFFSGLFSAWHSLLVNVITTGTIVALLTWVVMPLLTRVFSQWLFRESRNLAEADR